MTDPGLAEIIHALTKVKTRLTRHCPDPVERLGVDIALGRTIGLLGRAIDRRACDENREALAFVFQARDALITAKVYARHGDAWWLEDWLEFVREILACE